MCNTMIAIFKTQMSCSGDIHEYIVAAFTNKEKATEVLYKFKEYWPESDFRIGEYYPPKIDPTFEDLIWQGISPIENPDDELHELQRWVENL